ncbi:MAG: SGNH/GDSL hydrolase family protein, partial [Nocardioidaceae bacterium]
ARTPGTEVGGTEVGGAKRGARGRWVLLRHRRRSPQPEAEGPERTDSDGPGQSSEEDQLPV